MSRVFVAFREVLHLTTQHISDQGDQLLRQTCRLLHAVNPTDGESGCNFLHFNQTTVVSYRRDKRLGRLRANPHLPSSTCRCGEPR